MKKIIFALTLLLVIFTTSCIEAFIPLKQTVSLNTGNDSTQLIINDKEVGKGKIIVAHVSRGGAQVLAKTSGYKDQYLVLKPIPYKRPVAYYPLMLLDAPLCIFSSSGMFDFYSQKGESYNKENNLLLDKKLRFRQNGEKYVDLTSIKFDIDNYEKDISIVLSDYAPNNQAESYINSDNTYDQEKAKKELKAAKRRKKDKDFKLEDKSIKGEDPNYSAMVYGTLKKTGYIDTVNAVFLDHNNTLQVQGIIKKVRFYVVRVTYNCEFVQCKADIKWLMRNAYNEVFDSLTVSDFSGEFNSNNIGKETVYEMIGDAVDNSFLNIQNKSSFTKLLTIDSVYTSQDPILGLNRPQSIVKEAADAASACVIVRRKDKGHGSGFAITNDGYLLTNYHVIASKNANIYEDLIVRLNTGIELPAKVVRVNSKADLALLKVEYNFPKAFEVNPKKNFTLLNDVYAMGTPQSVELGQSISVGILSNERFVNNTSILQLNMSVNGGNSGGPVFDKTGILHGVICSKLVGKNVEGVCFAVPAYRIPSYLNLSYK